MKRQMVNGQLDGLILAVLADAPRHGYGVIEQLSARSSGVLESAEGTVYPALHRLEQSGALKSTWSDDSGRMRNVYDLTTRGREKLGEERDNWLEFRAAVEAIWGGVEWPEKR